MIKDLIDLKRKLLHNVMKSQIGKIQINDEVYVADLQTDLKTVFLVKIIDFRLRQSETIDIAIGLFEGLGKVTLVSGYASSGSFGNLDIQTFDFQYLIKGIQFLNIADIKSNICSFESEILKKVFNDTIIFSGGIEGELSKKPVRLLENDRFKINFYNGLNSRVTREMHYTARQYKYLSIKSIGGSLPIWDLLQIAGRFKKLIYLLGFGDGDNVDIFTFILYENRKKQRFQLYGWDYKLPRTKFNILNIHEITFTEYFNKEMVEKWIFSEDYQKLFDILFERHFLKQVSPENAFLNSIFALERFYRTFVKQIKNSLNSKIKYFTDIFRQVLPPDVETSNYLNRLEITRHSLSHFEDKPTAFIGIDLLYASVYVEAVLIISLLKNIGVSSEQIASLTQNTRGSISDMYYLNKALRFSYPLDLFSKNQ